MIYFFKKYLAPICSFGFFLLTYAQEDSQEKHYNFFDDQVGIENTGLYRGIVYAEKYRTINENTQFFQTRDFQKGSVCYDGQCYYDLDLRYDVYEDEVLLRLITKAGGGTLKLLKEHVERFQITDNKFIQIQPEEAPLLNNHGFYEVAYESAIFSLYTKYLKKSFERKDRKSLYYEFLDGASENVLKYKDNYTTFNTKKEIVTLFPEFKREIDKFYNVARGLRKSNPDGFKISLVKRIEILLSQTANQSK